MRQGFDGWWGATSRMTPEVYPRMFVSVFFLFLGQTARLLHISLPIAYTGARIFGGIALMVLVYQLIRRTFPQSFIKRIIAFCFVLFGTYVWGWGPNGPTVARLAHTWTELDPIFRWSFIPHHLWSKVGMLGVFLLLLRTRFTIRDGLILALTVFFTGMTNPVVYTTMVPVVGLWYLLELIRDKPTRKNIRQHVPWIAVGFVAGAILLYHRYLQTNIFPWTSYLLWEKILIFHVNPGEYALSFGPTLILCILAGPTLWRMGRVGSLYLSWVASSWIMLYIIGPFMPVTPERYLGGYQFIPLGIGAAVFIFSLKRTHFFKQALIILLFGYFAIGLYASFRQHAGYVAANRNNIQIYIPNDLVASFDYLSKNSKPEDVVMAPYEISTMIPGFTGLRVLAGHAMFTKDLAVKKALINVFFVGENPVLPKNAAWVLGPSSWIPLQDNMLVKRYNNRNYVIYSR